MDLNSNVAALNYVAAAKATQPSPQDASANRIHASCGEVFRGFQDTLATSDAASKQAMTEGVDPHALVHALAQTEFAVEAAVTVRDRVVEAYQEILRMPV